MKNKFSRSDIWWQTLKYSFLTLALFAPLSSQAFFGSHDENSKDIIKEVEASRLLESEKNTISVFQENVNAVVNVSNIQIARTGWWMQSEEIEVPAGAGSGFVWDKEGHIVTNFHVIQGGDSFVVSFHKDKETYEAKVVGAYPEKDIAVLKLKRTPKVLYPIKTGRSKSLRVGQKAMAIGNPFGLNHTITSGIISATGRKIQGIGGVHISGMIQTDCSINPGNSGGPLYDSKGNVIGMNTMIFSASGSSAGIGFSVPIDTIKPIVAQIIKYGKVKRPGLGIKLLEERLKQYFGIQRGIVVKYVNPKSPAARAGLMGIQKDRRGRYILGDIILQINGQDVNNYDEIFNVLDHYNAGDKVTIQYMRGNEKRKTILKLTEI